MADKKKNRGFYKRGKVWWCDFTASGERFQKSLETAVWNEALAKKKELEAEAQRGRLLPKAHSFGARLRFPDAADQYQAERKAHLAPKSIRMEKERLKPLRAYFSASPLKDISVDLIQAYIAYRKQAGAANRTVNMELGILRRILKRAKLWYRVSEDVKPLPERRNIGRALSHDQKVKLIKTAESKPEWQNARLAMTLALNTTMRACEIKGLRWRDIDFMERTLTIRRSKTEAGERLIPLIPEAWEAILELRERAKGFAGTEPEHYVFPTCEGRRKPDSTKPMMDWRTAWRKLTREAGLPGLRFHDMRHHAITELAESGESEQTIMAIAGHVSRKMLEHYSHIRVDAKRKALEALSGKPAKKAETGQHGGDHVTKHVTMGQLEGTVFPQPLEKIGGRCKTRTCDPLLVRQVL